MAIANMKKVSILAMKADKARLMSKMQQLGCVEVIERSARERAVFAEQEKARLMDLNKQIDRLDLAIKRLTPFDKVKQGMLDPRRVAGADQIASVMASKRDVMEVVDRTEAIERTRGELRAQEARAKAQIEQLTPWERLDVPLDKIGDTETCQLSLFTLPAKNHLSFTSAAQHLGAVEIEEISGNAEIAHILVAAHKEVLPKLDELVKTAEAARVTFPEAEGTAALALDQIKSRIMRVDEIRGQLNAEVDKLAENLPVLRVLRDVSALKRDQLSVSSHMEETQTAFLLTGWVPEYRETELKQALKKITPLCELEFENPGEDEKPPTLMRNGKVVSPFETIVQMFSSPDPNGFDPTVVMMPFWVCFFGMMVSDAGYGIVLGLLAAYLFKKLGRKSGMGRMAFILILGGISTVFWGAMYGGWFSIEGIKPILFAPMDQPMNMIILCLAVGVVHIFAGMSVAAYMNIKRGKWKDACYDQFSWMLVLIGLGLMIVDPMIGGIIAGIGTLTVLVMAGRPQKNPIKRVLSGLGSLYGISGYISDILSYARLFGMGLATGVIGMVFNKLAMMMTGTPIGWVFAIILLVFGHTFNLAINAMGAYVHSCRLQFIEFFSKFYESGGKDFRPLSTNTRYVDIEEGDIAA